MPKKRPRVVSLDEVKITRRGDIADFEYADPTMGGMSLTLGVDVDEMSDEELVERHNDMVRRMDALAASYEHVAIEVPVGSPQLRYAAEADQWVPRGDVLRCIVNDGGADGEATIEIDDRELSLREFGRILTTHAGWGMRIVFVPDDEIHERPTIETREPDDAARTALPPRAAEPRAPTANASSMDGDLQRMPIYQLKITLAETEPPVWRRVLVSGNVSLKKIDQVIQAAMGWTNSHLHVFASADGRTAFSNPRFELDDARDESKVKLRSLVRNVGDWFRYEYDFGDSWWHEVVVEAILRPGGAGRTPRCIDGRRACPPEDCGGVHGYAELVAAMKNRRHPERERFIEWLGGEFESDAFELDDANDRLRSLK